VLKKSSVLGQRSEDDDAVIAHAPRASYDVLHIAGKILRGAFDQDRRWPRV
jgi:hypothetical protein